MAGLTTKSKTVSKAGVGLDIGSHTIKVLEISNIPEKPKLAAIGMKRITGQSKESTVDAIKQLAGQARISLKDINISVSGPAVIVRFITMPKMTKEDLSSAIRFEAEKFIPFNINDCITDFQILRKDDHENKLEILLVAVKKEYVEERIRLVEAAGFSVRVVDIDSFALANAFAMNFIKADPDRTSALINIGYSLSTLSIVKSGMPYLVRDMPIGARDFDSAIAKELAVDQGTAEAMRANPPQDKAKEIIDSARLVFNNLVDEMRLPFSYYENQCGKSIDEIYLSGGGTELTGLDEMFQEAFGAKPVRWNPLQSLDKSAAGLDREIVDKMNHSFAVSTGLALR